MQIRHVVTITGDAPGASPAQSLAIEKAVARRFAEPSEPHAQPGTKPPPERAVKTHRNVELESTGHAAGTPRRDEVRAN
ncbi:hypothetical protein [Pandoraea oxalativorans]|uniref:Uncharacterized protein n=1 Tax=Pandoraea oxalativorans TaxID=573737 RepID=A0A0G3IHK4_9BURK|nr:hypothetical protein [Pandoraea oxalativorans]AKK24650.1 hypothetical protein MB84_27825 [Pandoraea oxalativorans]